MAFEQDEVAHENATTNNVATSIDNRTASQKHNSPNDDSHYREGISDAKRDSAVLIVGLGHQYPPFSLDSDQLRILLERQRADKTVVAQKVLDFSRMSTISSRPCIKPIDDSFWARSESPSIEELDIIFRKGGVDLTVQACKKALRESRRQPKDITQLVAATGTNAGSPGVDQLVAQRLGFKPETERTLVTGEGCAGALAALRTAASIAQSCSLRRRPATILVFAIELSSIGFHGAIDTLRRSDPDAVAVNLGLALFSDAAAALVVCNQLANVDLEETAIYDVADWGTMTVPDAGPTLKVQATGFVYTPDDRVLSLMQDNVGPLLDRLAKTSSCSERCDCVGGGGNSDKERAPIQPSDFDWALHPHSITFVDALCHSWGLQDGQMRASLDTFHKHGNSSSPTVLIVLDQLRRMGSGRDDVVASSLGPGFTLEMALLRRVRRDEVVEE